jgi:hypothetical protein
VEKVGEGGCDHILLAAVPGSSLARKLVILIFMPADEAKPSARGDLAKTPFAHLVLYIHKQRLSGTLIVDRGGFESKVVFRNGRAVAARPLPRGTMLQDGLLELCDLERASYTFWNDDLLGDAADVVKGSLDTFAFVADSLRGHVRDTVVASVVDRYRALPLSLLPNVDLKRLGLRGTEGRIAERLRTSAMTGDQFATESGLPLEEARKVLYLLVITGYATLSPLEVPGHEDPRSLSSDPPIGAAVSNWPTRGASPASVAPGSATMSAAPPKPSRPPDSMRPSRPSRGSMPAAASQRPPARSSVPAWQQLASMRPGASATPPAAPVVVPSAAPPPFETLDNAGKLRRAEQLAEHRNWGDAIRIVDALVARNPRNAEYLAMRAWLHYQTLTANEAPKAMTDLIERALRLDEQQPRALYLKGLVLKRMGKDQEAQRLFQRTLDADPHHLDAQRELRLAKMRK